METNSEEIERIGTKNPEKSSRRNELFGRSCPETNQETHVRGRINSISKIIRKNRQIYGIIFQI